MHSLMMFCWLSQNSLLVRSMLPCTWGKNGGSSSMQQVTKAWRGQAASLRCADLPFLCTSIT